MINEIKYLFLLEWKKFRSNTVMIVLAGIHIVLSPFILLSVRNVFKDLPPPLPSSKVFYEFPTVWDYQGYAGTWFVSFCLGFMIIYMITSEVGNKTMRQNIITGMTRKSYFVSKLLSMLLIAVFATIIYTISTILIGIFNTEGIDIELIFDNNFAIARYFLTCLGYMSFAFLLAMIIRKGTLTILTYFLYMMMLEGVFRMVYGYFFKHRSMNFWPMNSIEDLMPFPLYRLPDYYINKEWDFKLLLSYGEATGMTIFYIILFLGLAWNSFRKKDI
ncbi:MAG: ABC transporter permease subunit [Saprospiraceae bacterium]|nr:ABC transporter permease subunit [Saprospiraceae bacterium]